MDQIFYNKTIITRNGNILSTFVVFAISNTKITTKLKTNILEQYREKVMKWEAQKKNTINIRRTLKMYTKYNQKKVR